MRLTELAPAKLNLTLSVLGRRADGYHALDSLVAFASVGDTITLTMGSGDTSSAAPPLTVSGPFAAEFATPDSLAGNLVARARAAVETAAGRRFPAALHLEKNLPVASGIGGGSADAAATLRLLARAYPDETAGLDWHAIATSLGADVPVCLAGRSAWMTGIGDRLAPVTLPNLDIVLANPMAPVPSDKTRQVFRALAAPLLSEPDAPAPATAAIATRAALVDLMRTRGNDLSAAARRLVPAIADVEQRLSACVGCRLATLSGAGPTVIGVFDDAPSAAAGATALASAEPGWWIATTTTR